MVIFNIDRNEMQTLPTTRDPWAILQLVPSVMLDRENVGGNESSQQASFVAKGDFTNGANNIWALDGVDVTDPSDLGGSPIPYDFDMFDETDDDAEVRAAIAAARAAQTVRGALNGTLALPLIERHCRPDAGGVGKWSWGAASCGCSLRAGGRCCRGRRPSRGTPR